MNNSRKIGVSGTGYYIPPNVVTSQKLSELSGLPVSFFEETYGIEHKSAADPSETPCSMAIKATNNALEKAELTGKDIDLIIYCAAGFYDYRFWTPAAVIQQAIGATEAFAFEIKNGCNAVNVALNYCRLVMEDNDECENAIVVCGEKMSDLIDFNSPTSKSIMFYADGASAAVISRQSSGLHLKSFFSKTVETLSEHQQYVPAGGTVYPAFKGPYDMKEYFIQVRSPEKLSKIFEDIYVPNYLQAIDVALSNCGKTRADIDILLTNQLKRKITQEILSELNLTYEHTYTTINKVGHIGAGDTLLCLAKCVEENRIKPGDTVVLASSANGFSWGATVLEG